MLQVVGLGAACEAAHRDNVSLQAHFRDMRDLLQSRLLSKLQARLPDRPVVRILFYVVLVTI